MPQQNNHYYQQLQLAKHCQQTSTKAMHLGGLIRAKSLITTMYSEPLTLEQLAKAAHYAPHHFHRLFRHEFGMTPHQYLTRQRIERARDLLMTTQMDVTTVCLSVGFSSLGSFSTMFQRHTGYSPSHYRRRYFIGQWGAQPPVRLPSCFLQRYAHVQKARSEKRD